FTTTREDDICFSQTEQHQGVQHGIGATGAGAYHRVIWSAQVMTHADLSGCYVQYHLGDEERIEPGCTVAFGKFGHFVLERDQSTDTASENNADTVGIDIIGSQPGAFHSLIAGYQSELGKAVDLPGFFLIEELKRVQIFHFAGTSCAELGGIKQRYHIRH